jgi:SAM-dependent methyltransferase
VAPLSVSERISNLLQRVPSKPISAELLESVVGHPRNPPAFDADFYRTANPDLSGLSEANLFRHFLQFGISEGRNPSGFGGRAGLSQTLNQGQAILEIAPWTSPFFEGPNVKYADILTNDELLELAKKVSRDSLVIPQMDYLISPTNLNHSIDARFEIVASSHVIEHQPNLLEHLRQVGKLLVPGGRYVLAIPDKRFCFDHFKAESTLGDAVQADSEKRVRHTLETIVRKETLDTHNDSIRHWSGDHGEVGDPTQRRARAERMYEDSLNEYLDCHAWYFTPSSFRALISESHQRNLQPFAVENIYNTVRNGIEFYAVLGIE